MPSSFRAYLKDHLPDSIFRKLRRTYYFLQNKFHPRITESEFRQILTERLGIRKGSVVFIHSSVDKMFLDFPFYDLLEILKEAVGEEGTLLFPSSHFKIRAEEYLSRPDAVFDVKRSVTVRGLLPEMARMDEKAVRSLHPTNSVVSIGKLSEIMVSGHEKELYPCGTGTPFFRLTEHNGIIAGLGTDVDHLSFVHCVEDIMKDEFPLKTRNSSVFKCKVIDANGNASFVNTLVASEAIAKRDVIKFMKRHVPSAICNRFIYKGVRFFSADSKKLFERMADLARKGITIYSEF